MFLADRMNNLNVSGIRKVFDLASTLKNPINLSIGQPDFDVFPSVKKSAVEHIEKGFNRYTLSAGIPELRDALKKELVKKNIIFEDIMITSGVSGGLFLAVMAILNPLDEVIVPDPYFVMYPELAKLIGGKAVFLDTYPDFTIDPLKLQKLITKKTKILFLNSPSNPTGKILSKKNLMEIADVLKGTGIWVISDEIYDLFDFDNKHVSFSPFYEQTLTLNGFSKSAAMTGWRVGYAAGPKVLIEAMIKLQQYTYVCSPSFAQYASIEALKCNKDDIVKAYIKKRDIIYEGLKNHYDIIKPEGAFYAFLKHPVFNGDEVFQKALDKEVLLIPGSVFSKKNSHFRLSFVLPDDKLRLGINKLIEI